MRTPEVYETGVGGDGLRFLLLPPNTKSHFSGLAASLESAGILESN